MARSLLLAFAAAVVLLVAGFATYAWQPALPPDRTLLAGRFDPALAEKGAALAALGNCSSCHTLPDRPAFSGGVGVATAFGTIYASNITPDAETGIGDWSEAAFRRAMREGVDRAGRHLFPAFPYDHFTLVTDDDDKALYAFLMTRAPVKNVPPNSVISPFNIRALAAAWKLIFFRRGPWQADPSRDPAWNRGTYLVEGLGHCGTCHSPRGIFGGERRDRALAGGAVDGWQAFAINAGSPAPIPWSVDDLAAYLGRGWADLHGAAYGPMASVSVGLAAVPPADLAAIGTYVVSSMGVPDAGKIARLQHLRDSDTAEPSGVPAQSAQPAWKAGAALYAGACAGCHDGRTPLPLGGLPLELSTAAHAQDPTNLIRLTLRGLTPTPGGVGAGMPGLSRSMSDDQLDAVLSYLREIVAKEPAWPDLAKTIGKVAAEERGRPPLPVNMQPAASQ